MAVSQYVALSELDDLTVAPAALSSFSSSQKTLAIQAASSEFDGYLQSKGQQGLSSVPLAVKRHVANMAAWHLLTNRGFNPGAAGPNASGASELVRMAYEDALAYCRNVARGLVTLPRTEASPAPQQTPEVASDELRGWDTDSI